MMIRIMNMNMIMMMIGASHGALGEWVVTGGRMDGIHGGICRLMVVRLYLVPGIGFGSNLSSKTVYDRSKTKSMRRLRICQYTKSCR